MSVRDTLKGISEPSESDSPFPVVNVAVYTGAALEFTEAGRSAIVTVGVPERTRLLVKVSFSVSCAVPLHGPSRSYTYCLM